ncbi:MAG: hypothetical protein ACRD1Q_07430, partial [Vicinamibacterales bacterium]
MGKQGDDAVVENVGNRTGGLLLRGCRGDLTELDLSGGHRGLAVAGIDDNALAGFQSGQIELGLSTQDGRFVVQDDRHRFS